MTKKLENKLKFVGNSEHLNLPKTAFFCSRRVTPSIILKSYDWANDIASAGNCIISGNHSQIEKDVVYYLLKGQQPIIIALARGMKYRIEPELVEAFSTHQLLIVTPFAETIKRANEATARKRNSVMAEMADELFVAYAQPGGNVERLVLCELKNNKKVIVFDVAENAKLIHMGATIYS